MKRLREEAARRGTTLTALIEQGLHLALASRPAPRRRGKVSLPVSKSRGGTLPGVDLDNSAAVLGRMESDE